MSLVALEPDEIATDGWVPLDIDPRVAQQHAQLAQGLAGGPGIVVAWARLAFAGGRPMPAGGVLLSVCVNLLDRVPPRPTGHRTRVHVRERGPGRLAIVTVSTDLRAAAGPPFCVVTFVLLWPTARHQDA